MSRGGFAALVALVGFYLFTSPLSAAKDGDFLHLWTAGAMVVEGLRLYDPVAQKALLSQAFGGELPVWAARNDSLGCFFYPPPTALLYATVGWLPVRSAALVQAVANVLLGVGGAALLARLSGRSLPVATALLLLFPSFFFGFVLGQNGALSLLLLLGGGALIVERRFLLAGLVWGLLAYKPSWWLAVAWLPLLLGGWRAAAGLALGAAALCLGSLVLGLEPWRDFLALAPLLARLPEQGSYPLSLQFNLGGLLRRYDLVVLQLPAVALLVGLTLWRGRRWTDPRRLLGLGLVAATLVNPHLHHYDMLPGVLGVALLWGGWRGWLALLAHHGAFVAMELLDCSSWLPLPTLALLGLWLALLLRDDAVVEQAVEA